MKTHLNRLLLGKPFPQEYLCLAAESDSPPFQVQWESGPVSGQAHLFLGYKPLLLGFAHGSEPAPSKIAVFTISLPAISARPLARLSLLHVYTFYEGQKAFSIWQGVSGQHHFILPWHRLIQAFMKGLRPSKPDPIRLAHQDLRMVEIAYAIPRIIRIGSLGTKGLYNVFPTDLNGPWDDSHFMVSLRSNGLACAQLMHTGSLALEEVSVRYYQKAYQLGKNHMQPLRPITHFPICSQRSPKLNLPLFPLGKKLWELEILDQISIGIHTLFLLKQIHFTCLRPGGKTLAHRHATAAAWRQRKGLQDQYFFR